MKNHILVLDDDTRLRNLLGRFLEENNFKVSTAKDATEAQEIIATEQLDLAIIDVMIPGKNGIEFTKDLQNHQSTKELPIIILTARGGIDDRLEGLEAGAQDYLAKPFEPKELLLRINNILKRANISKQTKNTAPHPQESTAESVVPRAEESFCLFGNFAFNLHNHRLTKNDQFIYLTEGEAKILELLCLDIEKPVSREKIAEQISEKHSEIDLRTIDVQINRLRRKIEDKSKQPFHLQTIRNQGYILYR
jgi:two-component system phosphate regulon response regulator OmpR